MDIVQCECACRWSRLTGDPPLTERTRLNVREFTLNPGVKVSGSVNANANNLIIISLSLCFNGHFPGEPGLAVVY